MRLDEKILDLYGRPIEDEEGPLTVRRVCVMALTMPLRGDDQDAAATLKRYQFARILVRHNKESITLTSEQITLLKDRVGRGLRTDIAGPVMELLDPGVRDDQEPT